MPTPSPQFSLSGTLATIIRCSPWFRENSRSMDPCLSCRGLVSTAVIGLSGSLLSHEAMDRFYRALKWSFEALATGRWPRSDYMGRRYPRGSGGADRAGKRLARKHTAVLFLLQGRSGSLLEEHAGSQLSQQLAVCSLQCRSGPEPLVGSPSHSPVEAAAQILPASDGPCQAMSGLDAQQAPGHRCLHRGFGAGHNCLPEDVTWQGFLVQLLQGSVSRGTGVGKGLHA